VPIITRESPSTSYTRALAAGFADLLEPGDVVLLSGQLGSGKTTFTRGVAAGLGIDEKLVSSPTFVMLNVYPASGGTQRERPALAHLDAYRLHSVEDLDALGWDRVYDARAGCAARGYALLIEWPDRIAGALPPAGSCSTVSIEQTGRSARRFRIEIPESWSDRADFAHFAERPPIACRATGRMVSPTGASYPFIDEQARLADLYKWFSGSYQISRPIEREDIEEGD
jgi:tRNA threonylcarbamoyl adenosine modification protein YjeE